MRSYWCLLHILMALVASMPAFSQTSVSRTPKLLIHYHPNIETYFITERLVAERIGNYVFSNRNFDYSGQPLVTAAFKTFKQYKDSAVIIRIAERMAILRPLVMDNTPILTMLLYQQPFPGKGPLYPSLKTDPYQELKDEKVRTLVREIVADLQTFYITAHVGDFLQQHRAFYEGALREISKDIPPDIYSTMERYYGEHFAGYRVIITPAMPLYPAPDSYRGIGATINTPEGRLSYMIVSSSVMLDKKPALSNYTKFGFDNPPITQFLTVHEIGHSFINPPLAKYTAAIQQYAQLFTPLLKDTMVKQAIVDWHTCVTEHLVRLGEIRIAVQMKDTARVNWLRKMHIGELRFIFLPALEEKVKIYEQHRQQYRAFKQFLPELLTVFRDFTPAQTDQALKTVF